MHGPRQDPPAFPGGFSEKLMPSNMHARGPDCTFQKSCQDQVAWHTTCSDKTSEEVYELARPADWLAGLWGTDFLRKGQRVSDKIIGIKLPPEKWSIKGAGNLHPRIAHTYMPTHSFCANLEQQNPKTTCCTIMKINCTIHHGNRINWCNYGQMNIL